MKRTYPFFGLMGFILAALLPAWAVDQRTRSADAPARAHNTVTLSGAGSTFIYPIGVKWFEAYQAARGVQIKYQAIGSGGGRQQLKDKLVDFGASDVPLSDNELQAMPDHMLEIPTVAGAIGVIYNLPGLRSPLKLTGSVLADMYLGHITRWNDHRIVALNPAAKLPASPIYVSHQNGGSGTTYKFTTYLSAVSRVWAAKVGSGKTVNWPVGAGGQGCDGVAGILKQTPGGIGYVELAYAVHNHFGCALLKNPAGRFVGPSLEGTTAAAQASVAKLQRDVRSPIVNAPGANSYPISGFTFILVYKHQRDAEKGRETVKFLKWAIADGQKYCKRLLYAPLPAGVVAIDRILLNEIE